MARLAQFSVNTKAIKEGEWVRPDEALYDDLEILTRGPTDEYRDSISRRLERAARGFGGKVARVPSAQSRAVLVECLIEHIVLDVRNLVGRDGQPVTIEQFRDILRDPQYAELVDACLTAASSVGRIRDDEIEDAAKN